MKNKKVSEDVFANVLLILAILLYFIVMNFAYIELTKNQLLIGLKIVSIMVLVLGIIFIEIAYKKDSGKIALNGVEILVLAGYTLSVAHIVEIGNFQFSTYIIVSSYVFGIYYLLKAIIIYTKEKRAYLKSLSDIREIVSNEPVKKKAEKRK